MAKKARVYDGTAWQELASAQTDLTAYSTTAQMNTAITAGVGLVPILTQTIGTAVSSITVTNAFSSTYDNYLITLTNTTGSTANDSYQVQMRTGSTTATSSYFGTLGYWTYAGSASVAANNNASSWGNVGRGLGAGDKVTFAFNLFAPFLASKTTISTLGNTGGDLAGNYTGYHNSATSYDQVVINTASGNMTGGTIRVYGYKN